MRRVSIGLLPWLAMIAACGPVPGEQSPGVAAASAAPTPSAEKQHYESTLGTRAACVLMPQRAVRLKSQVGGELQAVHVKAGDFVQPGQLLAEINTRDRRVQLERLGIERQRLEARLPWLVEQAGQAEREAAAVSELYAPNAQRMNKEKLSLQSKRLELSDAQLQLKDIKLQMDQINEALRQAEIRSPMHGQVLTRSAEVGMVVGSPVTGSGAGDVLFEVADPLALKAECGLPEADAQRLALGMDMRLIIDGRKDVEFPVKVTRVAPSVVSEGAGSRLSFEAEFTVEPAQAVLPGMHATAVLVEKPQANSQRH
jgi:macrolide-specific efflux system membrane fusion protein